MGGCVEWHPREADRVRTEMRRHRLTPEGILVRTIMHVRNGGVVEQRAENRPNWKHEREYYYRVVLPMPDLFPKGLFVEILLHDSDPDLPEALLVNAHE
jgi:hypothetical protein